MYVGLGQVALGYNPCGMGYDFINFQCVHDPNCHDPITGGCPQNYQTFAIGTADAPVSASDVQAHLAQALQAAATVSAAPVQTPTPTLPAPPVLANASAAPAGAAASSAGIPTWLLVAAAVGIGVLLFSQG